MSGSADVPEGLSELSAAELARLARSHVDAMWDELRAASAGLGAVCHPRNVARHVPLGAAALAAGALGLVLGIRRGAMSGAPPAGAAGGRESIGRRVANAVAASVANAAGRAVPAFVGFWLARRQRKGGGTEKQDA